MTAPNAGELKVSKIRRGTVIDHITAGMAPAVLRILGVHPGFPSVAVVAMNVKSDALGHKDIVKLEDVVLDADTLQKIATIAPQATMNVIEDFEIVDKHEVSLPEVLRSILKCPNRHCIGNADEGVESHFALAETAPIAAYRCHYCEELVQADRAELIL